MGPPESSSRRNGSLAIKPVTIAWGAEYQAGEGRCKGLGFLAGPGAAVEESDPELSQQYFIDKIIDEQNANKRSQYGLQDQ
jgi:hypothetical protein